MFDGVCKKTKVFHSYKYIDLSARPFNKQSKFNLFESCLLLYFIVDVLFKASTLYKIIANLTSFSLIQRQKVQILGVDRSTTS